MKGIKAKLSITLLICLKMQPTRTFEFWFTVGAGAPNEKVFSATLAGPNQRYVVHGEGKDFHVYEIDWEAGSAALRKDIKLPASDPSILTEGWLISDLSYNVILASKAIVRFNVDPQNTNPDYNYMKYAVSESERYSYPFFAEKTTFIFVGTTNFASGYKFYRMVASHIGGVVEFDVNDNSRSYGTLTNTPWLVVSLMTSNIRLVFDYTNGYITGSSKVIKHHIKTGENYEITFM